MEHRTDHLKEFDLLFCCARTQLDEGCIERIRALLGTSPDWNLVLQLAAFHRVVPLLHRSLQAVHSSQLPAGLLNYLHPAVISAAAHNLTLLKELGRLTKLLEGEGVPSIAFKGPVLAHIAYGNVGLRPSTDLDILIRRGDLARLEHVLTADGYQPFRKVQHLKGIGKAFYIHLSRQYPFSRDEIFNLDVHTGHMPFGYHTPDRFDDLWRRSEQITIAGVTVTSFQPEDLLQILCFHGAKNRWEALKHVCDVAELIRARPEMNWDVVLERARLTRGERILNLGLTLANGWLDAPLPTDVLNRIRLDKRIERLSISLKESLFRSHLELLDHKDRFHFHMLTQDTLATKSRYLLYTLLRKISHQILQPPSQSLRTV
jgi:hypothetical protein